mgnify:CR=1 FL=1
MSKHFVYADILYLPCIFLALLDTTKELEKFQNVSLRPIIKSLNDLLRVYFQNHAVLKKIDLSNVSEAEKNHFITTSFLKGQQSPVFFGSAINNFGWHKIHWAIIRQTYTLHNSIVYYTIFF